MSFISKCHNEKSFSKVHLPSMTVRHQRSSSIKCCLPSLGLNFPFQVVFHQRSTISKGHIPSNVIINQMSFISKCNFPWKVVIRQTPSSIKGHISLKHIFYQMWSLIKGHLPSNLSSSIIHLSSNAVFHQRSTLINSMIVLIIKGHLPSKVFIYQRSCSIIGRLSLIVVFHNRSSSIKVLFHHRSTTIKGCLPSKVIHQQR